LQGEEDERESSAVDSSIGEPEKSVPIEVIVRDGD